MLRFDHVGIVAADLDAAATSLTALVGPCARSDRYDDPGLTVSVQFLKDSSGLVYELIAPLGDNSVVSTALRKQTNLLNQIAYLTDSLDSDGETFRNARALPLGPPKPAKAFGGAPVQFFMTELGFIIELIGDPDYRRQFST